MGNESGGEPGGSGLQDLGKLLKKTKEKYKAINPNDSRWPCPFCLHKAKTLVQCKIHLNKDHKMLTIENVRDATTERQCTEDAASNFTNDDLKEFLELVNSQITDQDALSQSLLSQNAKCSKCGFQAKNSRGLSIHMHSCNKKQASHCVETETIPSQESLIEKLIRYRGRRRIMKRIPKGARKLVCEELVKVILRCVSDNVDSSWEQLHAFAYDVLKLPPKDEKRKCSLATLIRKNISNQNNPIIEQPSRTTTRSKNQLIRTASEKLSDGDIKGSVRILCSDEVIAPYNLTTLNALISKHPKREEELDSNLGSNNDMSEQSLVSRAEILEGIRSFDNGSAGGIDGLRPQHLKDLVSQTNGHLADQLVDALSILNDVMMCGKVPASICPVMFGANLTALLKKSGGIRPIAVGNTLRRLSAKIMCNRVREDASNYLKPKQTGFGIPGGADAIVHSVRDFLLSSLDEDSIMVKLDYSNAFNSVIRAKMIAIVREKYPFMLPYVNQCYATKSYLVYGSDIILSEEGVQQGDPLGPLLFCLVIQPIIESLTSKLNEWYLDDGSIGGKLELVIADIKTIISASEEVGLKLNPSKCEVLRLKPLTDKELEALNEVIPGIMVPSPDDFCLLGAPLTLDGIPRALEQKTETIALLIARLKYLQAHQALFIMRNCLLIPKMMHLLRCSPCWLFKQNLSAFDQMMKLSVENIINVSLNENSWNQSSLPISRGGLGLILACDIASSAFISSMYSTKNLRNEILATNDEYLNNAVEEWEIESSVEAPLVKRSIQKSWSCPIMEKKLSTLIDSFEDDACQKARILAASEKESGLWLGALPSSSLGLCLDNDSLRVAVALRIGAKICYSHLCKCGKMVDEYGYHGLSCLKASGRHPPHHSFNETIRRGLVSAGIPALREPPGTVREDGKRPDGITLIPWSAGKCLIWDATCGDCR